MKATLKVALPVAAITVVAALARGASASPVDEPSEGEMSGAKVTLWRKLESIDALSPTQRLFLVLVAYGEGRYRPTAHNGSEGERDAARRGTTEQIAELAARCGVPREHLASGSWGTFQRLAPYWASDMAEIFGGAACPFMDPTIAAQRDLDLQIVDAIHIARSLQAYQGWKAYPTVGNLRLGWAAPSFMGYLTKYADRIAKYRDHARIAGLPPGFVDERIGLFPANAAAIYQQLRGGA